MRLTKARAIDITIECFEELYKTGGNFYDKLEWFVENYFNMGSCALCKYSLRHKASGCKYCPYYERFGHCDNNTPYSCWVEAATPKTRKKYAKKILAQLYQLRVKQVNIYLTPEEITRAWEDTFEDPVYFDHKPTAQEMFDSRLKSVATATANHAVKEIIKEIDTVVIYKKGIRSAVRCLSDTLENLIEEK